MAVFTNIGDTIEGKSVDCITKKWSSVALKIHPITQKRCRLYSADRTSEAVIIATRDTSHSKDIELKTAHFHRDENDILKADALTVYVENLKTINSVKIGGNSGRHNAQAVYLRDHTIASIKVPLEIYKKRLGLSANSIEVKQIKE